MYIIIVISYYVNSPYVQITIVIFIVNNFAKFISVKYNTIISNPKGIALIIIHC